jgi:uroporphyrin-III C-methyltransferase/precorrin-2 dehydrogenase/sirohydrochlorin ferrochelatase
VVDGPIGALVLAGRSSEAETALKDIPDLAAFAGALVSGQAEGRVTLVGAGPGDPDLLTIKALRALQDADIVFYDELVSPEILDRARRDASRVPVGRRVGKPGIGQHASAPPPSSKCRSPSGMRRCASPFSPRTRPGMRKSSIGPR